MNGGRRWVTSLWATEGRALQTGRLRNYLPFLALAVVGLFAGHVLLDSRLTVTRKANTSDLLTGPRLTLIATSTRLDKTTSKTRILREPS